MRLETVCSEYAMKCCPLLLVCHDEGLLQSALSEAGLQDLDRMEAQYQLLRFMVRREQPLASAGPRSGGRCAPAANPCQPAGRSSARHAVSDAIVGFRGLSTRQGTL